MNPHVPTTQPQQWSDHFPMVLTITLANFCHVLLRSFFLSFLLYLVYILHFPIKTTLSLNPGHGSKSLGALVFLMQSMVK